MDGRREEGREGRGEGEDDFYDHLVGSDGEDRLFSRQVQGQLDIHMRRKEAGPLPHTIHNVLTSTRSETKTIYKFSL